MSVNSTSTAAVTSSVMVAAVDNAPLVSFAWLLRSASIAALPALSICSPRKCAGPSISHLRAESMLRSTSVTRCGNPAMNWLTTNVRMPPRTAKPLNKTSVTATACGRPRESSQSTGGTSNALNISTSNTGTTMTSNLLRTHSSATIAARMTKNRHAQAAVLRTSGATEASSRLADIRQA